MRSAVVVNPAKQIDLDQLRETVDDALAAAGWPEPLWYETTVDDPGEGQTRQAVEAGAEVVFACGGDGTVLSCVNALVGTDVALAVARAVRSGEARLGILVDGAGIGSAIAANKVPGVRAAPCVDVPTARNAREHNDANVLTLGSRFVDAPRMRDIVQAFLTSRCTEERHARRVGKIKAIEASYLKS